MDLILRESVLCNNEEDLRAVWLLDGKRIEYVLEGRSDSRFFNDLRRHALQVDITVN